MKKIIIFIFLILACLFICNRSNPQLLPVCKNNMWGYIDKTNKLVIPFEYDITYPFSGNVALVCQKGKCGAINKKGKVIIPLVYDSINSKSQGLYAVEKNGKSGYVNSRGEFVIPLRDVSSQSFKEGLAVAYKNGKFGFINKKDKLVIGYDYDEARDFKNGLASVSKAGKWGVIDKQKIVMPIEYGWIEGKNGEFSVCKELGEVPSCGIITKSKTIIPLKYYGANLKSEGLYAIQTKRFAWSYYDENNKQKFNTEYAIANDFQDGIAMVCSEYNKCGYINKQGKPVIELKYEAISPFYGNVAAALYNKKWGFVDKKGKVIIPFQYDWTGFVF